MTAAACQSRQLAEVINVLDGTFPEPIEPCSEPYAHEVHVEHQLGLWARLCEAHEREAVQIPGYRRSVRIRST